MKLLLCLMEPVCACSQKCAVGFHYGPVAFQQYPIFIDPLQPTHIWVLASNLHQLYFQLKKTVISVHHIALLMLLPVISIMWCLLGPSSLVQCSRIVFRKYPVRISGHELYWQTFLLLSSCPPDVGMVAWLGPNYFFSTCFPIHISPFIHLFSII
jgi:hypothetical protein